MTKSVTQSAMDQAALYNPKGTASKLEREQHKLNFAAGRGAKKARKAGQRKMRNAHVSAESEKQLRYNAKPDRFYKIKRDRFMPLRPKIKTGAGTIKSKHVDQFLYQGEEHLHHDGRELVWVQADSGFEPYVCNGRMAASIAYAHRHDGAKLVRMHSYEQE